MNNKKTYFFFKLQNIDITILKMNCKTLQFINIIFDNESV